MNMKVHYTSHHMVPGSKVVENHGHQVTYIMKVGIFSSISSSSETAERQVKYLL